MADVAAALKDLSATSSSNSPSGATSIAAGLDDNLREIQGNFVRGLSHKGADIASVAGTTDIGAIEGLLHDITGTEIITGLGTVRAGIWKILKFEAAATLTHNATSLILLGGENRTTANGDVGIYFSEGSGNWREIAYFAVAINPGKAVSTDETQTLTNKTLTSPVINTAVTGTAIASQAQQETGTAVDVLVTPGRQHFHPSSAKAWVQYDSTGGILSSYNVASVTDNGAGNLSPVWGTDFSSSNHTVLATAEAASTPSNATTFVVQVLPVGRQAGGCNIVTIRLSDFTQQDVGAVNVVAFGDQA